MHVWVYSVGLCMWEDIISVEYSVLDTYSFSPQPLLEASLKWPPLLEPSQASSHHRRNSNTRRRRKRKAENGELRIKTVDIFPFGFWKFA